jgi:hypothetical protein
VRRSSARRPADVHLVRYTLAEGDDAVPPGGLVGFEDEDESVTDTLGISVVVCVVPWVGAGLAG